MHTSSIETEVFFIQEVSSVHTLPITGAFEKRAPGLLILNLALLLKEQINSEDVLNAI